MKETVGYKIKKRFFRFIGDIKWAGITHPFWFIVNAKTFQLKGHDYRKVEKLIQPGDILIRRFEGYVDKWLIPGFWNHGGIYVGNNNVIHAISDGVVQEDLIDFMRTDHIIILRPPFHYRQAAIKRAVATIGREYDFAFNFMDTLRFSCTELVNYCLDGIIPGKKRLGRLTIVADDIVNCNALEVIWDSRKDIPHG